MKWEGFGQFVTEMGKDVSDKVKNTADVVRQRQKLAVEESKLRDAYIALGEKFYDSHEGEVEEDYLALFESITEAKAAIVEYKEAINQLKNQVVCQECGASMAQDSSFCSNCGTKLK